MGCIQEEAMRHRWNTSGRGNRKRGTTLDFKTAENPSKYNLGTVGVSEFRMREYGRVK